MADTAVLQGVWPPGVKVCPPHRLSDNCCIYPRRRWMAKKLIETSETLTINHLLSKTVWMMEAEVTQEKAKEVFCLNRRCDRLQLIYFQRQQVFHLLDLNMLAQITQLSLQGWSHCVTQTYKKWCSAHLFEIQMTFILDDCLQKSPKLCVCSNYCVLADWKFTMVVLQMYKLLICLVRVNTSGKLTDMYRI